MQKENTPSCWTESLGLEMTRDINSTFSFFTTLQPYFIRCYFLCFESDLNSPQMLMTALTPQAALRSEQSHGSFAWFSLFSHLFCLKLKFCIVMSTFCSPDSGI